MSNPKKTIKNQKQKVNKPANKIAWRPTVFQIKCVISFALIFLSYRYTIPVDSLRDQQALTLIVVSVFLLWKPSPYQHLMKKFSYPKLMWFLIYITFIFPVLMLADVKYKDWDNAQMIKGLARDFPLLVEQLEQATGLDLEIKSNCMTTTEKFSNGVKTCEIMTVTGIDVANDAQKETAKTLIEKSNYIKIQKTHRDGLGYTLAYRNIKSCSFSIEASVFLSCLTAVRDANIKLPKEVFSTLE